MDNTVNLHHMCLLSYLEEGIFLEFYVVQYVQIDSVLDLYFSSRLM